jgi:hypothetical protein
MKFKTIIFTVLVFSSCDNLVRFEVPQPEGEKGMRSIPKKLLGTYLNLEDSSMIIITKDQIVKAMEGDESGLLSELDSIDRINIKGDTTYSEVDANLRIDITIKGDSVFQYFDYADTLFSFSSKDILRKFKGYYFLNHETDPNRWNVTRLGLTKHGIILGTIWDKEELENLRELTNTSSDSVYNFRPTKKQFKKFIRTKAFQSEERFVKI